MILVQKFGGTSVETPEKRMQCIGHIEKAILKGYKVVVVVSAMGRKGSPYATDTLLSLLGETPDVPKETVDSLMATGEMISVAVFVQALREQGICAYGMSGGQAGIITNEEYGNASITALQPQRLEDALAKCRVVVVAGFQGQTMSGNITTLGRGGSDTSAAALGVSLEAERVEIFTDVSGVYTADPRIVADAKPIPSMSYEDVVNYAYMGAKVIHPRAVEMAMKRSIPLVVRSTFDELEGTVITASSSLQETGRAIVGVAHTTGLCEFVVEAEGGEQAAVLRGLRGKSISLDFVSIERARILFTVPQQCQTEVKQVLVELNLKYNLNEGYAKLALVGSQMQGQVGIFERAVYALYGQNIDVMRTSDSHATIWFLVEETHVKQAVNALHRAFLQ